MNQEKIGNFIALCRKEKQLTQQDLADKLGITDKAISKWENGRCMPDISYLEALSKELNISVLELLKGEKITKEEQFNKEDVNPLLEALIKTNQKSDLYKLIFNIIIIILISIFYFTNRTYGFDNSYLEQLSNHISLIPFSNLYTLLYSGNYIDFTKNIIVNLLLSIPIGNMILFYTKNKKKYINSLVLLNVFLELAKWLLSIGIFDINDILIRICGGIIIILIKNNKNK